MTGSSSPAATLGSASEPLPALMCVPIFITSFINGLELRMRGEVRMRRGGGRAVLELPFDRRSMPEGFEPELLSYTLLTGLPMATLAVGSAQNPSIQARKTFQISRYLKIPDVGNLDTVYTSKGRLDKEFSVNFLISGEVNCRVPICGMAPVVERWQPRLGYPHIFDGSMQLAWQREDGSTILGWAQGTYSFDKESPALQQPQLRLIDFTLERYETGMVLSEHIFLLDKAAWQEQTLAV